MKCFITLGLDLSFFESTVEQDQPSDQDLHCFPLLLKIHAYNWNIAG